MAGYVRPCTFLGRQAIELGNALVRVQVTLSGGHIACLQRTEDLPTATRENDFNSPLWLPPWPTFDASVSAALPTAEFGQPIADEAATLSHILGHNLCLDVFGAHSDGELAASRRSPSSRAALNFHGEAGNVTWRVDEVQTDKDEASFTMAAHLPHTALDVARRFSLKSGTGVVTVSETLTNLVGFQRALGRAQHVTIGEAFLRGGDTVFSTNADRGHTWPDELDDSATWARDVDFDYPKIPAAAAGASPLDWRRYPRTEKNGDLCSLRIKPEDELGWFSVRNPRSGRTLVYAWERAAFPFLMTWEENKSRGHQPWSGRTLARGLEFSSYAFATNRKRNVEMGTLFGQPTFEWLDAKESKTTTFQMALLATPSDEATNVRPDPANPRRLVADGLAGADELPDLSAL